MTSKVKFYFRLFTIIYTIITSILYANVHPLENTQTDLKDYYISQEYEIEKLSLDIVKSGILDEKKDRLWFKNGSLYLYDASQNKEIKCDSKLSDEYLLAFGGFDCDMPQAYLEKNTITYEVTIQTKKNNEKFSRICKLTLTEKEGYEKISDKLYFCYEDL